jgi:hypothetical protein
VLLAKSRRKATLLVAIGGRDIEAGVHHGRHWAKDSLCRVPIGGDPTSNMSVDTLLEAIEKLRLNLIERQNASVAQDVPNIADIRIIVADFWLAGTGMPWSSALERDTTATAFARGQLTASGFDVQLNDVVRLDDAPFGQPRFAIAYPAQLLAAFDSLAQALHARLASVLPLSVPGWVCASRRKRIASAAFAVLDAGLMVIGHGTRHLENVSVRRIEMSADNAASASALREHWQRMQLREPRLRLIERLAVLNLVPTEGMTADLGRDFPRAALLRPLGGWPARLQLATVTFSRSLSLDAILPDGFMRPAQKVAAAALLLVAGFFVLHAWLAVGQARNLDEQVESMRVATVPLPSLPKVSSPEERAQVRAVNAAIVELNLPVAALLKALQPPKDIRVAILKVEISGASSSDPDGNPSIKILAEARSGEEMARYVSFVSARPPLTSAYLRRHEIVDSTPEHPYRFSMEAAWRE